MDDSITNVVFYSENYYYNGTIKNIENYWVAHGNGRLDWSGNFYVGNFKNNFFDGEGACYYNDGTIYEGFWVKNTKHGKGKILYSNGMIYEGNFINDKITGEGTLYTEEKEIIYKGEWNNNSFNGLGTYYKDGKIQYIGYWKNSLPHGKGIIYDDHKNVQCKGFFYEGILIFNMKNNNKVNIKLDGKNMIEINDLIKKSFTPNNTSDVLEKMNYLISNCVKPIINSDNIKQNQLEFIENNYKETVSTTMYTMNLLKKIKKFN